MKALLILLALSLCQRAAWAEEGPVQAGVRIVADNFRRPISLKFDFKNRAYVVEQKGRIIRVSKTGKHEKVFLDISKKTPKIWPGSERGLLDFTFHPRYSLNGRIFVHYSDRKGDTVLSEFKAKKGTVIAASERILLRARQPYSNHNGGQLDFGPDGYLYLGLGDGGSAADPKGNGQNLSTLLGAILRLDVSTAGVYSVPQDNPFQGKRYQKGEIWAYGLRNPWRFSFDQHWLYIGDVGQNRWEEIDVEDVRQGGGKNYGWNTVEGNECFKKSVCRKRGLTAPVHDYTIREGDDCSVTGGAVYRGKAMPEIYGHYFYSDFCSGHVRSFKHISGRAQNHKSWRHLNPNKEKWGRISSFGRDRKGNIYWLDYDRGSLLKLVAL